MKSQLNLSAAACLALLFSSSSYAGLISGFEAGLTGWETLGDVSVQSAAIGTSPTQGQHMGFVSTMNAGEKPFSGVPSLSAEQARLFLGLPGHLNGLPSLLNGFLDIMPTLKPPVGLTEVNYASVGDGGAMKTKFFAPQAGTLMFDWKKIGQDRDSAYFSVWSDTDPFRFNDWLYAGDGLGLDYPIVSSGVDMCSRLPELSFDPTFCQSFADDFNVETSWRTVSIDIAQPGWYSLGFGLGEIVDPNWATVLAVDNVRFQVPEPATIALIGIALLGIGATRRPRPVAPTD